jgi:predicted aminopeptidase
VRGKGTLSLLEQSLMLLIFALVTALCLKGFLAAELTAEKNAALDEAVLQDVAKAGNGAYVRAGNNEFGFNPIIDDLRKLEDEKYNSVVFEEYDEQFMYFLAIALFFFVLEMLVGDRRSKRHLFQR